MILGEKAHVFQVVPRLKTQQCLEWQLQPVASSKAFHTRSACRNFPLRENLGILCFTLPKLFGQSTQHNRCVYSETMTFGFHAAAWTVWRDKRDAADDWETHTHTRQELDHLSDPSATESRKTLPKPHFILLYFIIIHIIYIYNYIYDYGGHQLRLKCAQVRHGCPAVPGRCLRWSLTPPGPRWPPAR